MTDVGGRDGLILNVSNRCNLRCVFCYEHGCRVEEPPSFEAVREILTEPRDTPPSILMYMGAESFLRPDLEALIRLASDQGIAYVGVATNGTLVRKRSQMEPLLRAGLNHLELSIHSLDPTHASELSGRTFTHARQERGLAVLDDLVADYPITLTINIVLCALNLGDVIPLIEGVERDHPGLAPMYHVKYPYSVAEIAPRVAPALHDEIRASGLVSSIPDALRSRVAFEHFPLCVLAPHFAQSCELIGLCLDRTEQYYLTLPELRSGAQGFALGRPCEFEAACDGCPAQLVCPGLAPGYMAHAGGPGHCLPLGSTPAEILGEVARFRADHALEMSLPVDRPEVVAVVLDRAEAALAWRRRPVPEPASSPVVTVDQDPRAYDEILQEYRSAYGALTPRVPELIALRAGLQSALSLSVPRGAAGDRRVTQAQAFAARAKLDLEVANSPRGGRRVIFRAPTPPPDLRSPAQREVFGRPPACCTTARDTDRTLGDRVWDLISADTHVSWLMNPFLAATPFQLFRHLPCGFDCRATRDGASALYEAIGQHNRRLVEQVRRFRTAPAFYPDLGGRAFLFEGECLAEVIRYDAVYLGGVGASSPLGRPGTTEDPAQKTLADDLTQALSAGDGLTLAGPELTIRRGQRLVARFNRPPGLRWRLLDFI